MLHPPMTLVTVHARRTFGSLDGLDFVLEIPMWTFFRFVVIYRRFSSVILDIMGVGAISPFVAA